MFFKTPWWDLKFFWWVNQGLRNEVLDFLMPLFSSKLLGAFLLGILFGVVIYKKSWSRLVGLGLLVILLGLCDYSINFPKKAIGRVRPLNALAGANFFEDGKWQKRPLNFIPGKKKGHSYPSAHAANSLLLGLALGVIFKKRFLRFLFYLLPLAVGFSRVYLAKHYPLDVLAGYLWGSMFYLLFLVLLPYLEVLKWEKWFQKKSF